jgi:hypothetical protein
MRKVTLIIGRSLLSRLLSRSIFIASTLLSSRLAGGDDADRVLDLDVDQEKQASRAVQSDPFYEIIVSPITVTVTLLQSHR